MMSLEQNTAILDSVRSLTKHQRRILFLLTLGYQNKVIGGALGISEYAVKSHMTRILEALCCTNRTQAALVGFCLLNKLKIDDIVGRRRVLTEQHLPTDRQLDMHFLGASGARAQAGDRSDRGCGSAATEGAGDPLSLTGRRAMSL